MDSTRRPILELLVGPRLSPGVTDVVVRTARSCTPRAAGPGVLGAARLATSLDAPRLRDAIDDPTVPLAVVVDRAPVDEAVTARADVVLAPADLAVTALAEVLRLPRVDPWRHRPVAPFV